VSKEHTPIQPVFGCKKLPAMCNSSPGAELLEVLLMKGKEYNGTKQQ
jgi:hypothetical protein